MGVAASSPESAQAAAAELGADRAFDSAEELVRDPDVDVVHICTPNHLHVPLAEAALAAGKHVICEKPLALDAGGRATARRRRGRLGAPGRRSVRLPLLPDGARGARARRQRADRRAAPSARHLPPGLAPALRRRQLARGRAAGRGLARVRRHRLALVRPGRVRLRPPHRPPLRADCSPPCPSESARRAARRSTPDARRGRARTRHDRGRRRRPVRDGRGRDRVGGHQPDLGRAQEPALDRARRGRGGARLRPGAAPKSSGAGVARP